MFRYIVKDEAGVSAPEYAVLLLLLVGSVVVAVGALNDATTGAFNNASNRINDANVASGSQTSGSNGGVWSSGTSPSSSGSSTASSSPSNSPPSSNGDGHGNSDNAPGHLKGGAGSPSAKPFAPGQNK